MYRITPLKLFETIHLENKVDFPVLEHPNRGRGRWVVRSHLLRSKRPHKEGSVRELESPLAFSSLLVIGRVSDGFTICGSVVFDVAEDKSWEEDEHRKVVMKWFKVGQNALELCVSWLHLGRIRREFSRNLSIRIYYSLDHHLK